MVGIKIRDVAVYHPEKVVDNEFYLNHFKEKGRDIGHFLEVMGRDKRYVIDNDSESTLTMGIEAARQVMDKCGLIGEDIDMIVFSTQVPETTFPTNAIYVHRALNVKNECSCQDSNASCAGMTLAVDNTSRYMLSSKNVKRALIVGSDYNTLLANPDQEITYANYGDAACALILEKVEDEVGFIDSAYYSDPVHSDFIRYPQNGLAAETKSDSFNKYIDWHQFDAGESIDACYHVIDKVLQDNGLTASDISVFCMSQFALVNIQKMQERFDIPDAKISYVGDVYGYTGTSSPFIAYSEALDQGKINSGDYILFCTVGAGYQWSAVLFKA